MASHGNSLLPPLPGDAEDFERRAEARLRRRLLEGAWRPDAVGKIREFFQAETANRLGHVDTTRNLHRDLTRQLAVRYQQPPTKLHEDEAATEVITPLIAPLWPVAARNERYVISANTCFIRTDWAAVDTPEEGLQHTVITPDLVSVITDPERPHVAVYALHARRREDPTDRKWKWFFDEWDVRGDEPTFRIILPRDSDPDLERATDKTADFVKAGPDALSGVGYHWRIDEVPIIGLVPYIRDPGFAGLFDWREGREVVEATLIAAALWSMWAYSVRDAAHPIRAIADGEFVGATGSIGKGGKATVAMLSDPTTMHPVRSTGGGQARSMEWGPAVDPERLQLAIESYTQGAAQSAGLSPDDFQRSGAAESGYAIALKSEAKRREQRRMGPAFQQADGLTLGLSASLLNRYDSGTPTLPETGWAPHYAEISMTPAEKTDRREDVKARLEAGTASLVDAVMAEHPGMDRAAATAHLEVVQQERRLFRADTPPTA